MTSSRLAKRTKRSLAQRTREAMLRILLALSIIISGSLYLLGGTIGAAADTAASSTTASYYSASGADNSSLDTLGGGKITLDARDVDMRDLMSALALKMGANIILLEDKPNKISLQLKDNSPREALEMVMQSEGLAYLQQGDIIVVGKPDALQKEFFNQMHITRFDTYYISAASLKKLIQDLGLSMKSINMDSNPNAIWVQGTVQDLRKVRELINAVDTLDSQVSLDHKTITLTHISPDRAFELLLFAGVRLERFVLLDNRIMVFDRTLLTRWDEVEALAKNLDIPAASRQKIFIYQLKNTVAGDAEKRLTDIRFPDVKTSAYNYDRFGKELMVICPPHLENEVRNALYSIDQARYKTRVPVLTVTGEKARNKLDAHRQLLSELSGIPVGSMYISNNLSGDLSAPMYVLWVEETPDKVQLIKDLIDEMKDSK